MAKRKTTRRNRTGGRQSALVPHPTIPLNRDNWSVGAAARIAHRERDDLIAALVDPGERGLRVRQCLEMWYQQPDDQGRIRYWAPPTKDHLRRENRHSASSYVESLIREHVDILSQADLYVISPAMMETALAAAMTLTVDDLATIQWRGLGMDRGFLMLPDELIRRGGPRNSQDLDDVRVIAWKPGQITDDNGVVHEVLDINMWSQFYGGVQLASMDRLAAALDSCGVSHPALAFSGHDFAMPSGADLNRPVAAGEVERTLGSWRPQGQIVDDPNGDLVIRFLLAFMRLCDQEVATTSRQSVEYGARSTNGTMSRKWGDCRVVELRRAKSPESGEQRQVNWNHRWVVQMHKRRQWYPKEGVHKVIFVGPYVKGPDGAPFKPTQEPVRALVR